MRRTYIRNGQFTPLGWHCIHCGDNDNIADKPIDVAILKKLIPQFIQSNISVNLSDAEYERVKELYEGI